MYDGDRMSSGIEEAAKALAAREDMWGSVRLAFTPGQLAGEDRSVSSLLKHTLELDDDGLLRREVCEEVLLASFALSPKSRLRFYLALVWIDADRYTAITDQVDGVVRLGAIAPVAEIVRLILLQDILEPGRRERVESLLRSV